MNDTTAGTTDPTPYEHTLKLQGDLVTASTAAHRQAIKELIAQGIKTLSIDLADCAMVDSSGIGLLVATHNSLTKLGGRLALTHASEDLRELFQTMRLQQHFSIGA